MDSNEHKILILEDVPADAELMEIELRKGGVAFASKRVMTREDFTDALESFAPDLILSDYSLPQFDGLSALEIAQKTHAEIPFIFVSGVMGDERAVETLKKGAVDYVLKDRLVKLAPAVKRAFHDIEMANELKEKISDLERLVNSMVGRELKMVELKQQIAALKEQLAASRPVPPSGGTPPTAVVAS